MPLTLLAPHTPQLFSGAVSWQSSSGLTHPTDSSRRAIRMEPTIRVVEVVPSASEQMRRSAGGNYERYAKARAGELNGCCDVRGATRGTIVRERLKCEGSLRLRRSGASLRFTHGELTGSQQQAVRCI